MKKIIKTPKSPKSPKIPKSPKSPKTPKSPKSPKTPKSPKETNMTDKVIKLKNYHEMDSDKITPKDLVEILQDDIEERNIKKMLVIALDDNDVSYYVSKLNSDQIIALLETIKLLIISDRLDQ